MASPANTFDVVVVGASLAGSAAAIELGKAGLRTLLVDKASFPRRKACGEGLSCQGAQYLRELGISPKTYLNEANEFFGYRILTFPSLSRVPRELVARTSQPRGWGFSRETLDCALVERALQSPGIAAHLGEAVHTLRRDKRSWLVAAGSSEFEARYVVIATGPGVPGFTSPYVLQKQVGSGRVGCSSIATVVSGQLPPLVTLLPSHQGEIYVTPLGEGQANISVVGTRSFVRGYKGGEVLAGILRERLGLQLVFDSPGIGAAHFEARHMSTDPFLYLVGDSQESFDPICGMGMSHALATGIAAAHFIREARNGSILPSRALGGYHRCQEGMARGIRRYSQGVRTLINWYRRAPLCFSPLTPSVAGRCVAALQSPMKPLSAFKVNQTSRKGAYEAQLTSS
jgi:flavin-dependent dehydrogenase